MYGKEALQIAEPLYERVFFRQMPIQVEVTQNPRSGSTDVCGLKQSNASTPRQTVSLLPTHSICDFLKKVKPIFPKISAYQEDTIENTHYDFSGCAFAASLRAWAGDVPPCQQLLHRTAPI